MATDKKYRYPGINFFTKDDKDIFCGRDDDAQKLFNRTMLNNTIVLHGESGAGKSSLVRAGLIPLLEKQNEIRLRQGKPQYLPITIGLDAVRRETVNKSTNAATGTEAINSIADNDILVKYTLTQINTQAALRAEQLPFISTKQNDLWYTAKLFEKNNYTLLLMFDQFEELQGFSQEQVTCFTEKLAALFASTMPDELCDEYNSNTGHIRLETMTDEERSTYSRDISFIEQPLSVRLLFALREDRLGTMSLLGDYFPDILKNDFFLQSLTEKNARKAISEPCTKPGDFASPLFTIEPEAVDTIIESLKLKQRQKGMYDPIELQIVCRRIEKKVIETGLTKVSSKDLPPVENAIREFYDEKWNIIKAKYKLGDMALLNVKKHFIEKLVVNRKRNPVLEESLVRNDTDKKMAADLVAEGLVRIIPSGNDRIYQLCHDRFVEPMLVDTIMIRSGEDAEQKAKQRRRNAGIIIGSVILLSAALLFYIIYKKGKTEEENKMLNLMTTIKRAGNPTLSYVIASDWLKKNSGSAEMKRRLGRLDSLNIVYLTGMYPAMSGILSAEIKDNTFLVAEKNGNTKWDMKKGELVEHVTTKEKHYSKKVPLSNGENRYIVDYNDTLYVEDNNGSTLFALETSVFSDNSDVCLSPDGRYLYAEDSIYDIQSRLKSQLPEYKIILSKKELIKPALTALAFVSNDSYAAAYEDGAILLYSISRKKNIVINRPDTVRLPDINYKKGNKNQSDSANQDNGIKNADDLVTEENRITSLRTDWKQRYLLALNSHKDNDIYSILKKKDVSGSGDVTRSSDSISYLKKLDGSSDVVTCLDFSQDGKLLLTGGNDGITTLWDLETLEKISTLKIHNGAAITYAAFTNGDREIITATSNDIAYTWSMESPQELYKKDKLYRFAAFNYEVWYTDEKAYGKPRSTATTKGLYSALLHNLMNMPSGIEFRDDVIYETAVNNAFENIKAMHKELLSRKDFGQVISPVNEALLSKLYYPVIIGGSPLLKKEKGLTYLEGRKIAAVKDIVYLHQYFLDSVIFANNSIGMLMFRTNATAQNLERKKDYTSQAAFIRFYEDTVLKPVKARYPPNNLLKRLQRNIDINWFRHYLFSGNLSEAAKKAEALAKLPAEKWRNDSIYLVICHLAAGNTDGATAVYKMLLQRESKISLNNNKRTLRIFLKSLMQRNIAVPAVEKFRKDFPESVRENDEPEN